MIKKNLKNIIKRKKSVDFTYINFTHHRISRETRDYIKLIANTFTPIEFDNHLELYLLVIQRIRLMMIKKGKKKKMVNN